MNPRLARLVGQPLEAVRAFNLAVHQDQRVEMVLLPIGNGLTLARKVL
jgi:predicted O-methyltransferase YrrM